MSLVRLVHRLINCHIQNVFVDVVVIQALVVIRVRLIHQVHQVHPALLVLLAVVAVVRVVVGALQGVGRGICRYFYLMMQSPERNLHVVKRLLGHASITSILEYIDESVDNLRDILEAELMGREY
ncbi:Uncharacterised protein [Proteus mirabilis]|nr:hypothetical protein [Proteus mirabilis]SUC49403.1 Uncharacterised protein [Proteus mirabilis]